MSRNTTLENRASPKMAATGTRWGIFGASRIAHDFIVAMKTLPEDEHTVVAVSSRSLERATEFAKRHGVEKAYGSYEELARDKNVEVVYVSTIHPEHALLCKLALNHGKHVLCEKPMTMNLKDTKELFELAKAKGLFIMEVGYAELGSSIFWHQGLIAEYPAHLMFKLIYCSRSPAVNICISKQQRNKRL